MEPPGGSGRRRVGRDAATRIALLLASLTALRIGTTESAAWEQRSRGFELSETGWIGWLLILVAAGFLFGLAMRLPGALRYRVTWPILLGIVPAFMIVHTVLLLGYGQSLPGILNVIRFYMSIRAQFALAILLGVALASGFVLPGIATEHRATDR